MNRAMNLGLHKRPATFDKPDGPQSQSGVHGEVKILYPTGTRTPTSRSSSSYSVAIPAALFRLLLSIHIHNSTHNKNINRIFCDKFCYKTVWP